MRRTWLIAFVALAAVLLTSAAPAQEFKLDIGGTTYTKWLWGTNRYEGSLYNFTTIPGEGWGDNGQGTEIELLLDAKVTRYVEVKARLHSRFSQNFWTNGGGWGSFTGDPGGSNTCVGGDCGEYDERSNQYVKLRGATVILTPGYSWLDSAVIGASDWGMFDPFTIGKIRYIDRDNVNGLLFSGSLLDKKLTWDAARISLFRNWMGPGYTTGAYNASDGAYAAQFKYTASSMIDFGGIFEWVNDIEIDPTDYNLDDGKDTRMRFRNTVVGAKAGIHVSPKVDVRAAYYYSTSESANDLAPASYGWVGYGSVIAGAHKDWTGKLNLDFNDPFGIGLSFLVEGFRIGGEYVSLLAARREADVLLTEGYDATWAFPGPNNTKFGVFGSSPGPGPGDFNRSVIGYGGWDGTAQQVVNLNVDNEFTDFDEPMAEVALGWEGITFVPKFSTGALELQAEYTHIGYNTNWQAFGDDARPLDQNLYPGAELDTGVGHNFRSAYAPFQEKKTDIAALNGKYVLDVGKGVDVFGKVKVISETNKRLDDARYLPYRPGDCPTTGTLGCRNVVNNYYGANNTAGQYYNPGVITVNGVTGYQWKPFDDISDDDRDLSYWMFNLGAGYQVTNDLYGSIMYAYYNADLQDGNTALQGYNLHEMASGTHKKNQVIARLRYSLGGIAECGLEYQWNFGTYDPDFGPGFVTQYATEAIARDHNVAVGSRGFSGRYGGWNSLEQRDFDQQRLKAYMKIGF